MFRARAIPKCLSNWTLRSAQQGETVFALRSDEVETENHPAYVSCALRSVAEVGLSARTREYGGTARTLAGSVRSCSFNYTGSAGGAYGRRRSALFSTDAAPCRRFAPSPIDSHDA